MVQQAVTYRGRDAVLCDAAVAHGKGCWKQQNMTAASAHLIHVVASAKPARLPCTV